MLPEVVRRLKYQAELAVGRLNRGLSPLEIEIAMKVAPYTMTSPARIAALVSATEYIVRAGIPGAVVECGVWKGGSMMAAAMTLMHLDNVRDLYLYDTFEGMTDASSSDFDLRGRPATRLHLRGRRGRTNWFEVPLDAVRSNLASTGWPMNHAHFVKGPVETTIPATLPAEIALLRLDTDWYESTRHELEHLFPLLRPGGILIIDDYGHWTGARKAVDEYFKATPVYLQRIDYTGRLVLKR